MNNNYEKNILRLMELILEDHGCNVESLNFAKGVFSIVKFDMCRRLFGEVLKEKHCELIQSRKTATDEYRERVAEFPTIFDQVVENMNLFDIQINNIEDFISGFQLVSGTYKNNIYSLEQIYRNKNRGMKSSFYVWDVFLKSCKVRYFLGNVMDCFNYDGYFREFFGKSVASISWHECWGSIPRFYDYILDREIISRVLDIIFDKNLMAELEEYVASDCKTEIVDLSDRAKELVTNDYDTCCRLVKLKNYKGNKYNPLLLLTCFGILVEAEVASCEQINNSLAGYKIDIDKFKGGCYECISHAIAPHSAAEISYKFDFSTGVVEEVEEELSKKDEEETTLKVEEEKAQKSSLFGKFKKRLRKK